MSDQSAKVIIARDYSEERQALCLVDQLTPEMCRLKIGKEMFTRFGPEFVKFIVSKGYDVFLDLKFHDIPTTVAKACTAAAGLGVWMINVHASGGMRMMEEAKQAVSNSGRSPMVIAVTVLTSMDDDTLRSTGVSRSPRDQVLALANMARKAGLDGIVCSAHEAEEVRAHTASDFVLVTPGIRPEATANNDQKRVMTPLQAVEAGADYIVIGRPVTESDDPVSVLRTINSEIG